MTRMHNVWMFFFNDTSTTEIYTLSLHDALPISGAARADAAGLAQHHRRLQPPGLLHVRGGGDGLVPEQRPAAGPLDRKSTRLNSSHANISYAVFFLKKNIDGVTDRPDVHSDDDY